MKGEYRCHNPSCGRMLEVGGLAVFEKNTRRTFCPGERAPLEEGSCARGFIEHYVKQLTENYGCQSSSAWKMASKGSYVFVRLEEL